MITVGFQVLSNWNQDKTIDNEIGEYLILTMNKIYTSMQWNRIRLT